MLLIADELFMNLKLEKN